MTHAEVEAFLGPPGSTALGDFYRLGVTSKIEFPKYELHLMISFDDETDVVATVEVD